MKKYSIKLIWISIIVLIIREMMIPYLITPAVNPTIEFLLIKAILNIFVNIMQSLVLLNVLIFILGLRVRFECLSRVLR